MSQLAKQAAVGGIVIICLLGMVGLSSALVAGVITFYWNFAAPLIWNEAPALSFWTAWSVFSLAEVGILFFNLGRRK